MTAVEEDIRNGSVNRSNTERCTVKKNSTLQSNIGTTNIGDRTTNISGDYKVFKVFIDYMLVTMPHP